MLGDIHLFRGTSEGFPGNSVLQRLGISPASVDPLVATIFAVESNTRGGNGILLFGSQRGFQITVGKEYIGDIKLRVKQIIAYRQTLDELPQGMSGELLLLGEGGENLQPKNLLVGQD